jgi:glutathione peroxidase
MTYLIQFLILATFISSPLKAETSKNTNDFYSIPIEFNDGQKSMMNHFKGKVLLIVNTASKCGFTSQYEGLQKIYEKYRSQGLEIIGVPCNQFLFQEPGSNAEIKKFCELKYKTTFPLLDKSNVKGSKQHALYKFLQNNYEDKSDVAWNFEKYLVSRDGKVLNRFKSTVKPEDERITKAIQEALKEVLR